MILFCVQANATDYWADVDASGSVCSEVDRCATIQEALDALKASGGVGGDRICVADGTYTAGFTVDYTFPSGGTDNPIKILNCEAGTVVINKSETISSWTDNGSNLYTSNVIAQGVSINVFKDTTRSLRESDCLNLDSDFEHCSVGDGTIQIYSSTNPALATWRVGTSSTVNEIDYVRNWEVDGIDVLYAGRGYDIGNSQNTTNYIDTENITLKNLEVGYGTVRVINIEGSPLNPNKNIILDTVHVHHSYDTGTDNGHCIKFGSNFARPYIVNDVVTVQNCTINDCWYAGIQFSDGAANGYFINNTIYNQSQKGIASGGGIRCGDADNCNILGNTIYGTGGFGTGVYIQYENDGGVNIIGNKIYDFPVHGIYIFGAPGHENVLIANNLIYNNGTTGIRYDQVLSSTLANNTFYDNGHTSLYGTGASISINNANAKGIKSYNNICHNIDSQCLVVTSGSGFYSDYNIYYREDSSTLITYYGTAYSNFSIYQSAVPIDSHSKNVDPELTDPSNSDFTIGISSPSGTGLGLNLSTYFQDDFNDDPRGANFDFGAYQISDIVGELNIRGLNFL